MKVIDIPISKAIQLKNSRGEFKDETMAQLMQSIKENGLLQPIGVCKNGSKFEVLYGNRRLVAFKKLGRKTIPAVIKETPEFETDADLMNLTENIQREDVTLPEIGRYLTILSEDGLSNKEIAARLGMATSWVTAAKKAFHNVPKEIREKVVVNLGGRKRAPAGKFAMSYVQKIETSRTKYGLTPVQAKKLYQMATEEGFDPTRTDEYADYILKSPKMNPSDVVEEVSKYKKRVHASFYLEEDDYDELYTKHIVSGPFKSIGAVIAAGFNRQITPKVKIQTKV